MNWLSFTLALTVFISTSSAQNLYEAEKRDREIISILKKAIADSPAKDSKNYKAHFANIISHTYLTGYRDVEVTHENCDHDTAAFIFDNDRDYIYFCPSYYAMSWGHQIAILIHEYAHIIGTDNECDAEWMTYVALKRAGKSHYFYWGYDCQP